MGSDPLLNLWLSPICFVAWRPCLGSHTWAGWCSAHTTSVVIANVMMPRTLLDHWKYWHKVSSIIQLNVKIEFISHLFKKKAYFAYWWFSSFVETRRWWWYSLQRWLMVRMECGENSKQYRKPILRRQIKKLIEMTTHTHGSVAWMNRISKAVASSGSASLLAPIRILRAFSFLCLAEAVCMDGGDFPFIFIWLYVSKGWYCQRISWHRHDSMLYLQAKHKSVISIYSVSCYSHYMQVLWL